MRKIILILLCCMLMSGCSSGISKEDFDSISSDLEKYKNEVNEYKMLYDDAQERNDELENYYMSLDSFAGENIAVNFKVVPVTTVEELSYYKPGTLFYFIGNGGTGTYGLKSWCVLSGEIEKDYQVLLHNQPDGSFQEDFFTTLDNIFSYGKLYAFVENNTILNESLESRANIQEDISTDNPIVLTTGTYVVGADIPVGKYDIVGIEKGNIRVCSQEKDYADIVNEIIKPGEITYANVKLENGYTVNVVLGGKIELELK